MTDLICKLCGQPMADTRCPVSASWRGQLNLADAILLCCLYPVFDHEGFTKEQAAANNVFVQRYNFWRSKTDLHLWASLNGVV